MKLKLFKCFVLLVALAISFQTQAQTQSPRKCISFYEAVSRYVTGTTGISTALTAITIEAWLYPYPGTNSGTIQTYVSINPEVAVLRYDGSAYGGTNQLHFYIKNAAGNHVSIRANNVIQASTWMHVAGTYDGTTLKLYLNGKLLKSATAVGLYPPSGSFALGANSNGTNIFHGKMDEVSVWNYARTTADIREDMYRAAPITDAGLTNYWKFNEGQGSTLADSKGTATGTILNMSNEYWLNSSFPFAAGAVNTQKVTATGTKTFTGTGVTMNFTAKSGTDSIVVSRIDTLPSGSPTVTTAFNSQYWEIRRFGTGTFTTNLTFTINDDITSGHEKHPNFIKLYYRSGNSYDAWSLIATASSANAAGNSATFNGITSFEGQYMVCLNTPSNTPGTALSFNGTNNYINCGTASGLNITGSLTVEAWINATSWKPNVWEGTIVGKENSDNKGYILRCGNNGKLSFIFGSGTWHEVVSGSVLPLNQWTHVAGVYNGSTMFIYVNGVQVGQQSVSATIGVSSNPLYIGSSPGFSGRFFAGNIDEVSVWNVARSASQIGCDMYNPLATVEAGLVSYWQFNDGSGTNVVDVAGSSNGTTNGTAYQWVQSLAMVIPVVKDASNKTNSGFIANWSAPTVGTVDSYNLYVATDSSFTNMLSGYNPFNTTNTSQALTGLTTTYQPYYYRVRAVKTAASGLGANSGFKKGTSVISDVVPSGSGTSSSPYQISSIGNLQWMMNNTASWNKYFVLSTNIDASNTSYWNNGTGFTPIGNSSINFTGNFNGQGYSIDGININRPTTDNVGFFGIAVGDSIKNMALTNLNIKGQNNVGGFIGNNQGSLNKCYVTGNVHATGNNAGGLVGYSDGNEDNCFSRANVTADQNNAGGLLGTKANGIANYSYATGAVSSGLNSKGGIVGAVSAEANIENSYWDTQTTGQTLGYNSNAGTFNAWGKTTAQMTVQSTYTGWDFFGETANGTNNNWIRITGINYDYPSIFFPSIPITKAATNVDNTTVTLNWDIIILGILKPEYHGVCWNTTGSPTLADSKVQLAVPNVGSYSTNLTNLPINTTYYYRAFTRSAKDTVYGNVISFTTLTSITPEGDGSVANPYRISNLQNLLYLSTHSCLWDKGYTFIQTANINAAETRNWNGGQGFIPIGNQSVNFKGHYHGKGNSIDSLYINRPGSDYVAFFGYISQTPSSGKSNIDSLSLTNVNITGRSNVGGLGGLAVDFNISHCSVIGGSVTATNSEYSAGVGGMFGSTSGYNANNNSTSHCFAAVAVSGQGEVGGFVGQTYGGYINQCYSAGSVSGTGEYVGGFVGYRMCLGNIYSLDSSYYDIQSSGQATGAGRNDYPAYNHLQGKTTAEMKTQTTYDGWNFSTDWKISGSVNNGYPYLDYPVTQISTAPVSNIANNTATATGSINHIGALAITAHGFYWNTTGTPTAADNKVNMGATTTSGDYSANITGLRHNTTYYLQAYAIDAQDTLYGSVVSFTTTYVITGGTCTTTGNPGTSSYDRIKIPDNNTLDLTNNYSIEMWINPSLVTANQRYPGVLLYKGSSGYYLRRLTSGNYLGLTFDDMSTADNILAQDKWNHIAAVNDNGIRHIYVNGVEYPLTGTPKTVTANTDALIIGNKIDYPSGTGSRFRGAFDEFSLWNTALSQNQIRENMHFPLTGSEIGLVSYWQYDEGSGSTVNDKMGINNGTILTADRLNYYTPQTNSIFKVSTIPFGSGFSNTQVVSAQGTTNFTNTGLSINFTGKSNIDSIVVARIDTFPNINPTGLDAVFDRQYWAIHKYGDGGYTANLTFTINEDLTSTDEHQSGNIVLYTRTGVDDASWTKLASAASVNAANNQATFNGLTDIVTVNDPPDKIYYLGQYLIAREQCLVYIPDANLKSALLLAPGLDANNDGEIQCSEALAFTGNLKLANKNIADFTGIEAFANATELACGNNQMTSLDLTSNKALVKLSCANSNSLTSLKVTGLKSLTTIECRLSKITNLDLSTNTALTDLSCGGNDLTSLNVTGLTSLLAIRCDDNQLTTLDVSSNTALNNLNCNTNSLTNLNVSSLNQLQYLSCYSNSLARLDVSSNTNLTNLNCYSNLLTSLNVSSNTALNSLSCQNNSLTSLDVKNGNNINFSNFNATGNPNLTCIQVDDATWSTTNWTNKDAGASYSNECGYISYTISVGVNPENSGSTNGGGNYYSGATVSLSATPAEGYSFSNWTENGTQVSTSATYSFTATANRALVANFTQNSYSVTGGVNPPNSGLIGGSVKTDPQQFLNLLATFGANITLMAYPAVGYTFGNWTNNGIVISDASTFVLTVLDNINLVANFIPISYSISASTNPVSCGTITGTGNYHIGETGSVTATAITGYTFSYWTENGTIISPLATYPFIVTGNRTLVANFTQKSYLISANTMTPTFGMVTGSGNYIHGNNVSVTATPNTGYIFSNWTENGNVVSTSANYTFTAVQNRNLLANFTLGLGSYTIATLVNTANTGTVTGGGNYANGATVSVNATPAYGYTFTNWTVNAVEVSNSATYSFTANSNRTLVANFTLSSYLISANSSPENTGTISGAGSYIHGSNVLLTATAATGYTFISWKIDTMVVSTNSTYSFTADSSKTLVANFMLNSYLISANVNPIVTGNITGTGNYNHGEMVSLTATAETGYTFINWKENDMEVSNAENYSFTANSDRTLVANFTQISYSISTNINIANSGTVTGAGNYNLGVNVSLTATPETGNTFINWTENGVEVSTDANYSFTASSNRVLVANFTLNTYLISANVNTANSGTVTGAGSYNYGDYVSLTATAETGYTFNYWIEGETQISTDAIYSFTAESNRDLVTNFIINSYSIEANVNLVNSGTITGTGNYDFGTEVSLTATANTGYTFFNWTEDGTEISTDAMFTFTATANRTLVANFSIIEGISDINETNSISVYPNPNNGKFTIGFDNNYSGEISVKVYNVIGLEIDKFKFNKSTEKFYYDIDLRNQLNGYYYIEIISSKEKATKTIIIK